MSEANLEQRFQSLQVQPGTAGLVWLGQAGYLLKSPAGITVMVDPYLSEYALQQWGLARAIPPGIDHSAFNPTLFLSSHWHEDHLDQPIVRHYAGQPDVIFGGPSTCLVRANAWGWPAERSRLLDLGMSISVGDVSVTATYSRHDTPTAQAGDAVGFLIELGGVKVWDVADTEYDARLRPLVAEQIDVALTPINGVGGNLTDREAALLMSYVRPKIAIPMHYNMWTPDDFGTGATLDPQAFVDFYRLIGGGETRILEVGEIAICSAGGASHG